MYARDKFKEECSNILEIVGIEKDKIKLEKPPRNIEADLAFPCFALGGNPAEKAKELSEKINSKFKKTSLINKTEPNGPYVNFHANDSIYSEITLKEILKMKSKYGSSKKKNNKILIDFSSPNIAKPMNIGHLRSTIIGQSLYNIFSFLGYKCIGDNHLGDWGTQFGRLITAYKLWGNKKELEKRGVKYLVELYVKFHEEESKNENLGNEARNWFKKLEQGDKETKLLWKKFYDISIKEFDKIYDILGVKFDLTMGESVYYKEGQEIVKAALSSGIAEESEGAIVIKFDDTIPLIIQKSDESTLYSTRDLACIKYRMKKFSPQKIIYVIGSDQKLYLKQLFAAAKKLGYTTDFFHVDFGMMKMSGEKMSTRGGKFVILEEIIEESIKRAGKIIEEKNPDLKNRKEVAKQVGIGAIVFNDLKQDRIKDMEFDWDRVLNFEGDSCPYLQYSYVRTNSILEKSNKIGGVPKKMVLEKEESLLIKKLSEFPNVIEDSAHQYKPNIIAQYLLELAATFNEFYSKCKVIGNEKRISEIASGKNNWHSFEKWYVFAKYRNSG